MSATDYAHAACRSTNIDPDALYVTGKTQHEVTPLCRGCQVRIACLSEALENRIEFGIWGGMTERQRRALLRRHPHDWDLVITTGPLTTTGKR